MNDVVGVPDGEWKTYDENGRLESEGRYFKSKFDGDWKFYYPDGKLLRTASFNGIRAYDYGGNVIIGEFKEYYQTGQLAVSRLYNDEGLQDGESLVYYENGNVFERAVFDEGRIMQFRQFKPDGQAYNNGTFQNGNGTIKVYNIQGQIAQEGVMENGVPKQ
jgi:antitoxin component YwqK of YwqJK toxin-antitoxin module